MKKIEKDYVESYNRPEECFAIAAAFFVIVLIVSIGLNVLQFLKIYQLLHR